MFVKIILLHVFSIVHIIFLFNGKSLIAVSNNKTENNIYKEQFNVEDSFFPRHFPKELLIEIFQKQGVAKDSANVCKYWEEARSSPSIPLILQITTEERLLYLLEGPTYFNGAYKKLKFMFWFSPISPQLEVFVNKIKPIYIGFKSHSFARLEISNIEALSNIHTLDLRRMNVKDVSCLGNTHTLYLSHTKVENVSALGNVHTLDLSFTNVKNVSALSNVHTLNLSYTNVEDVSALKNVKILYLCGTKVKDVSGLENVRLLDIRETEVKNASVLKNVQILYAYETKAQDGGILKNTHMFY